MANKYFISAFLEVDTIADGNEITRELARKGNLFNTEEEARKALHFVKYQIGKYEKELHGLRDKSICSSINVSSSANTI